MTANQIAAASNREAERHNTTVETETIRHNQATEAIDTERNSITSAYNQRSLDLTEWYNKAYIEYLNASEEDQVALKEELNSIEQYKADNDAWYRGEMTRLQSSLNEADISYKNALTSSVNENVNIEKKKLYYEGQKTEATINDILFQQTQLRKRIENETKKIENDFLLGQISQSQRESEISLRNQELELKNKEYEMQLSEANARIEEINKQIEVLNMTRWEKGSKIATDIVKTGVGVATFLW